MCRIKSTASATLLHTLLQISLVAPSLHLFTGSPTDTAQPTPRSLEVRLLNIPGVDLLAPFLWSYRSLLAQSHVHLNAKCQSCHACLLVAYGLHSQGHPRRPPRLPSMCGHYALIIPCTFMFPRLRFCKNAFPHLCSSKSKHRHPSHSLLFQKLFLPHPKQRQLLSLNSCNILIISSNPFPITLHNNIIYVFEYLS